MALTAACAGGQPRISRCATALTRISDPGQVMMTIVADELIVHRLTAKNTLRREDYIRQACSNPFRAWHEHELKHARLLPQVPRY